jgi:protein-disulfide isomerase
MSKRQEIREKHRRNERTQRFVWIGLIVLAALLIAGIMVYATLPRAVGKILEPTLIAHPQANFNAMGDPNAPVKLIEYADFQCPFCLRFSKDTEAQIVETYVATGKVYFEYDAVVVVGAESSRAAEGAYCAGDQGKFWEMHDILFANQGAENSGAMNDTRIAAFAEHMGVDMPKFNECFSSGKYKSKVTGGMQDAIQKIHAASNFAEIVAAQQYTTSGLSTPTFLINDKMVAGAQGFANFQQVIEAALAAAGK